MLAINMNAGNVFLALARDHTRAGTLPPWAELTLTNTHDQVTIHLDPAALRTLATAMLEHAREILGEAPS